MASPVQLSRLQSVVAAAQASERKWGVPASVTMAQWIFESTWGTSQLALKANNYFGIKATHLADPNTYVEMMTAEYVHGKRVMMLQDFEKYASPEDSFEAHARLLALAPRYKPAMAVCGNPTTFALQLQECGYSTDPEYCNKLLSEIRVQDLKAYEITPMVPVVGEAK